VPDPRTGPGFRARCPHDDGTTAHVAVDLHGRVSLDAFTRFLRALRRCPCGAGLVVLDVAAPEPKDANAAQCAATAEAVQPHVRVRHGRSADALRAVLRDGPRHTSEVASALGVSDDAACQLLRRASTVVERVRRGVWKLREGRDDG